MTATYATCDRNEYAPVMSSPDDMIIELGIEVRFASEEELRSMLNVEQLDAMHNGNCGYGQDALDMLADWMVESGEFIK